MGRYSIILCVVGVFCGVVRGVDSTREANSRSDNEGDDNVESVSYDNGGVNGRAHFSPFTLAFFLDSRIAFSNSRLFFSDSFSSFRALSFFFALKFLLLLPFFTFLRLLPFLCPFFLPSHFLCFLLHPFFHKTDFVFFLTFDFFHFRRLFAFGEELVVVVDPGKKLTVSFNPYVKIFRWWGVEVYPDCFAARSMMNGVDAFSRNSLCSRNFKTCSYDDDEIRWRSRPNVCIRYCANSILSSALV